MIPLKDYLFPGKLVDKSEVLKAVIKAHSPGQIPRDYGGIFRRDSFEALHTYNQIQIEWFKAGSALNNLLRS